ncbi:MAG: ATP-binding cassette domain-containing protein [Alphaproteobacteria bacterium]|jgi:ABC-type glutathione transport system ATPase component|nr:ATP-binding cassette domain-containing protein [Alphaproteobacteria bacterium]
MIKVIMGESGVGKTTYLKQLLIKLSQKEVGYLPQEIAGIFNPTRTIYLQIFEVDFKKGDFNYYLEKLNLKYLENSLNRYPYEFSMGELQRIALLIVFLKSSNKKQIFLDEPCAFLDKKNQDSLVDIFFFYKIPITLITHNLDFALKLNGTVKIMKNGELENFSSQYGIPNNLDIPYFVPEFTHIYKAKLVLIIGESGVGKTTYLRKFHNFLLNKGVNVAFLAQDYALSLSPLISILKILLEAIKVREKKIFTNKQDVKEVIKVFKELNLNTNILKKYPHELSQGEKQKVLIIRASLLKCYKILLDEPTANMDTLSEQNIINFLLQLQNKYSIDIAIVSHSQGLLKTLQNKANYIINFNKNSKLK